jgi:HD-GYP domain-containing protein (c-di-GMP phosphodiesterase class II)
VTSNASLSAALDACHADVDGHAARVAAHARTIATRLGWDGASLRDLELGSRLHDIGKLAIRPEVLAKPGRLEPAELAEMRVHPVEGMWLIAGVEALRPALPYVLFHHERWDGGGYPTGRAAAEIPLEGRLMAVADAFDAMTSDRPYRRGLPIDEAVAEVRRCSGTQFDPEIVSLFVDAVASGDVELVAA